MGQDEERQRHGRLFAYYYSELMIGYGLGSSFQGVVDKLSQHFRRCNFVAFEDLRVLISSADDHGGHKEMIQQNGIRHDEIKHCGGIRSSDVSNGRGRRLVIDRRSGYGDDQFGMEPHELTDHLAYSDAIEKRLFDLFLPELSDITETSYRERKLFDYARDDKPF